MQRAAQLQHDGGLINQEGVICDKCVLTTWMDELDRATRERLCVI